MGGDIQVGLRSLIFLFVCLFNTASFLSSIGIKPNQATTITEQSYAHGSSAFLPPPKEPQHHLLFFSSQEESSPPSSTASASAKFTMASDSKPTNTQLVPFMY